MRRRVVKFLSFMSVIGLLTYCSNTSKPPEVIQIVTTADYAPFGYKDKHGELTGFDVELIKMIMKYLKMEFSFEELSFDEVLSAVEGARADIGMGGLAITPDREEKFEFSHPYVKSPQALVVSADNPAVDIHGLNPKTLLIQKGASYPQMLKKLMGMYPEASIVELKDIHHAIAEFKSNNTPHTVIVIDNAVAQELFKEMPELNIKVIGLQEEGLDIGFAIPHGKGHLRRKINQALKALSPEIKQLKDKYGIER